MTSQTELFPNIEPELELSDELKDCALKYLQDGQESALAICELLIKHNGATSERFSSGRPHIFVPVCFYLESLVSAGILRLKRSTHRDRLYEFNIQW